MSPKNDSSDLFSKLSQKRTEKEEMEKSPSDALVQKSQISRRQLGKRSNTDYIQKGAYIKRTTDKAVKRLLIESDMDFSELVEKLLNQWIQEQV